MLRIATRSSRLKSSSTSTFSISMRICSMINSTSLASNKCSRRTTLTIPGKWYSSRAMPQQVQVTHRCREVAPGSVAVVAIEVAEEATKNVEVVTNVEAATSTTMILQDTRNCNKTQRGKSSLMMTSSDGCEDPLITKMGLRES
jgi:hypothetical protein